MNSRGGLQLVRIIPNVNLPRWYPEPEVREAYSILPPCYLVCTSLCPNVPEHGKPYQQRLGKAQWLLIRMLAPETV
ncbi:hypothetical protein QBC44DRAFT_322575 [Cladorrhinum sp. PSN332]|nr:hypothetical protein QBC44DRAFT_322575 [Cladorrhinum sp. PSN332]